MDTTQCFNMDNNTLNQNFVINPMLFQQQTNINMNANNNLINQNILYNQMMQNMNNTIFFVCIPEPKNQFLGFLHEYLMILIIT